MTSDDVFAEAARRGLILQILLQLGETSWQACFVSPRSAAARSLNGFGATARVALTEALAQHDAAAPAAEDDLFAGL
jgi:hypothetical protein